MDEEYDAAMEKQSPRFYDIRFGILIAIIISILLFKYFGSQPIKQAPPYSSPSTQQQPNDSLQNASGKPNNAIAR
jgi:hypothetical protein